MKFYKNTNNILKLLSIVVLLGLFNYSYQVKLEVKSEEPATTPPPQNNPSDAVYKRVVDYVNKMAEEKMKSSNIMLKKKLAGALPEGFPEETIKKALETREDKKKWSKIMALPTEIYRFCLYPLTKVNYVKWCNNNFYGTKMKGDSCLYNFCEVCCDHLVFIYQNSARKNLIGELLQLNQQQGEKSIKDIVDKNQVMNCKHECKKTYPVDMPTPTPKTPKDPTLGTEKNPAMSCMDIKKWGPATSKSGVYWVDIPSKGSQKVFCDMETDKGGWTLFFNYVHQPGQELLLNENKLPSDLKSSSHMYLKNAGFSSRDAKEVRFMCTERAKGDKKYWHFKTANPEIVQVAFKADQSILKANSIVSSYQELRAPANIANKYTNSVDKSQINSFQFVGKNPKGGFTATIFGSAPNDAYWTVKGDNADESYECGSSHKPTGDNTGDDSPSMVFSHHSIWFRGLAPSDDEARDRYINNLGKKK